MSPLRKQTIFTKRVILDEIFIFRDSVILEYQLIEKGENIAKRYFLVLSVFGVDSYIYIKSMKQIIRAYTFFLLLWWLIMVFSYTASGQIVVSGADLSYQLNPNADLHITHKVISKSSKKWTVMEVETRNKTSFDSLVYAYAFINSLNTPVANNFAIVSLTNFELSVLENKRMYAFESAEADTNYLIFRIGVKGSDAYFTYIINLNVYSGFFISKTNLTIPFLTNYASVNTPLKFAKLDGARSNFSLRFYSQKFTPSLPPMANIKKNKSFGQADTTFIIAADSTLLPTKEGMYSVFEEGDEKAISFFKISNKNYPQLSNITEIIDASIFLFTKKEKDKLMASSNPKKDYDAFWLENTNSAERAGKMIGAYFKRVKEANDMFTTYKEGWKTDMGMIYIIFGSPDKVFRNEGSVEWVYNKTYELPNLNFKFYLKGGATSEVFELERNIKYQNIWFRAIDLWRKGKKNL